MQITPAILIGDINEFKRLVRTLDFTDSLDIDIARPPFVENLTVQYEEIKDFIDYSNKSVGFHLMVDNPKMDLLNMFNSGLDQKTIRVYLHQECNPEGLGDFKWPSNWLKGIAVKIESKLESLEFYNNFDEVQFMSIETGVQGNPFKPEVIDKVKALRSMGYTKTISLDGGINMDTIGLIKNIDINRISVGSYLQKSQNPSESYRMMEEYLNK